MAGILDREELIEQAYFFRTFRERQAGNQATQEILEGIHEEILSTTRLPMAIQFLATEMKHTGHRLSQSCKGATHIVKLWEPNEYPQLAANEFFCLTAARRCGFDVPPFRLAEDGMALVIDRFDLRMDGSYRGFEDFCPLNARRTEEKYRGSYETSILRRFTQFANSSYVNEDLEKLFTLIALHCALRTVRRT